MEKKYVERITLASELDKKVACAEIKVGDIIIRGVHVWRSGNGRLRVFFPSYHVVGPVWQDSVVVSAEVRSEIEAELIAAYREQRKEEQGKAAKREE
jgi:DNA-binding cell septation regulator SpoVG